MGALTASRNTAKRAGEDFSFPVAASTKIFGGALVAINSSGYLTKGAVSTSLKCVGRADEYVDNSTGADGALSCRVSRGVFCFANSASTDLIARSDIGADCYIVDDQTVAKTSGSSARSIAGKIRDVDSDGVWVEI